MDGDKIRISILTVIVTAVTAIGVYVEYMEYVPGKIINPTLPIICILDIGLIVCMVLTFLLDNKYIIKIDNRMHLKWHKLSFETQEYIRFPFKILLFIAIITAIGILLTNWANRG